MNRVPVQPHLVRWARERAGYSVDALVGRFPKIGAWECGELLPTLKQLEAFAKATPLFAAPCMSRSSRSWGPPISATTW